MAKKLDQILVIDLEATCWPEKPPEGQDSEIIEIGLCILDVATGVRLDKASILVRPEHSTISEYCTVLTTLTQEELEQGISFQEACSLLQTRYESKERLWASFGDYDRRMFESECRSHKVEYPFGKGHINVKSLFAVAQNLKRELPLDEAMHWLGFPLEGHHHRGADDAWNIARILGHLLLRAREEGNRTGEGQQ
jgi:inhibitor of KinA sporulation pathway (predicted exonuclease)